MTYLTKGTQPLVPKERSLRQEALPARFFFSTQQSFRLFSDNLLRKISWLSVLLQGRS